MKGRRERKQRHGHRKLPGEFREAQRPPVQVAAEATRARSAPTAEQSAARRAGLSGLMRTVIGPEQRPADRYVGRGGAERTCTVTPRSDPSAHSAGPLAALSRDAARNLQAWGPLQVLRRRNPRPACAELVARLTVNPVGASARNHGSAVRGAPRPRLAVSKTRPPRPGERVPLDKLIQKFCPRETRKGAN